jgi:hypothetical protein
MSELEVQSTAEVVPGLTQWQRVANTFTAPSKTFDDIKRGNKSWWLPFVITVLATYVLFAAITFQVGWGQVAENSIHLNPKTEEKLAQLTPDQHATAMKYTQYSIEGSFAASPLLILATVALGSLIMLGTINFGFGGKAKFGAIFTVWIYASLPGLFKALLGSLVLYTGAAPESFNIGNFAPTNVGAFLNPLETNKALYTLATSLDVISIWSMAILAIGLATVAGVRRSSGYIAVFGWWALVILISVGYAAISG